MKNKKSLLFLGLFALVLVLGVGYAVVSQTTLSINGDATTATSTMNVVFTGEKTTATSANSTAVVTPTVSADSKKAEIEITGLSKVGETASATYTIKNKEADMAADLAVEATGTNDYFKVTASLANENIQPDKETTVTVTVEVLKLPINEGDSTVNVSATVTATPAQPTAKAS